MVGYLTVSSLDVMCTRQGYSCLWGTQEGRVTSDRKGHINSLVTVTLSCNASALDFSMKMHCLLVSILIASF